MLLLDLKHSGKLCEDLIIRGSNDGSKGSHTEAASSLLRVSCYRLNSSSSQDNVTNKTRSPAHPRPGQGVVPSMSRWLAWGDKCKALHSLTGAARGYGAAGHGRKQAARTHPSVSDRRSSVVAVKVRAPARSHLECEIPRPEPGHVGAARRLLSG